ncbi:MAG: NADH-quinone oxidoreductase subunit NuoK [Paracoccaceae bacterium]|jgi:NADH-quinone oxidoreductase subunit K
MIPVSWYLILAAILFVTGAAGVLVRRNVLIVLMSLELMLNSVNINLLAFGHQLQDLRGQIIAIFVIAITAAEVAVALGILVALLRNKHSLEVEDLAILKG